MSISVVKCSWVKCGEVLQCSDGLSSKVSNIIRRLMDNMKCSGVLQFSDGLSNKVSNIIKRRYGQYKVAAYMYFTSTITTFLHIL